MDAIKLSVPLWIIVNENGTTPSLKDPGGIGDFLLFFSTAERARTFIDSMKASGYSPFRIASSQTAIDLITKAAQGSGVPVFVGLDLTIVAGGFNGGFLPASDAIRVVVSTSTNGQGSS
jgi:hypothetical protein